jgi:phage terminase large subunit GpA-like protein
MATPKIKVINIRPSYLEVELQKFLNTLDVRQIVKIDFVSSGSGYTEIILCSIIYVELEDVRDMKIDTIVS